MIENCVFSNAIFLSLYISLKVNLPITVNLYAPVHETHGSIHVLFFILTSEGTHNKVLKFTSISDK